MSETWITLPEFPTYAVSDQGRVKRIVATQVPCGKRFPAGLVLKFKWAGRNKDYAQVCPRKDGKTFYRYVHILVAQAFLPNPDNKPTVNHKDGVKANNAVDNLEWATYAEQTQHGLAHGLLEQSPLTGRFA
jgi:hypothetical protein